MNSVGKSSAKYDQDKLRWDLIPLEAVEECVKILTFGAQKYGENRWQHLEDFEDAINKVRPSTFKKESVIPFVMELVNSKYYVVIDKKHRRISK